jgi:hypothetical protein
MNTVYGGGFRAGNNKYVYGLGLTPDNENLFVCYIDIIEVPKKEWASVEPNQETKDNELVISKHISSKLDKDYREYIQKRRESINSGKETDKETTENKTIEKIISSISDALKNIEFK